MLTDRKIINVFNLNGRNGSIFCAHFLFFSHQFLWTSLSGYHSTFIEVYTGSFFHLLLTLKLFWWACYCQLRKYGYFILFLFFYGIVHVSDFALSSISLFLTLSLFVLCVVGFWVFICICQHVFHYCFVDLYLGLINCFR